MLYKVYKDEGVEKKGSVPFFEAYVVKLSLSLKEEGVSVNAKVL